MKKNYNNNFCSYCFFSYVNIQVSATGNMMKNTEITVSNSPELWEKFLKYDLCITDYDSLSIEEQNLCKFIFETELNSEDTILTCKMYT